MKITKCMCCMEELTDEKAKCPHCGFSEEETPSLPHQLPYRSILNGVYMVGKAIGEGGFGITYIGYDLNLDIKVAIKEFYPDGFVGRDGFQSHTVRSYQGDSTVFFNKGKDKFLEEARSLGKFMQLEGIVSVKDFFLENNTVYIVMEYLEGQSLKEYAREKGGKIEADELLSIMKPVLESLIEVHKSDIIHRDISPDNIIICKDGKVKLIDFGAARQASPDGEKTMSVMLKKGYSPEEQYRSRGEQGTWTDVYSLCATIYAMLTGIKPDEPLDRMENETLQPLSKVGVKLKKRQEDVLKKGLEIKAVDRVQTVEELYSGLYKEGKANEFLTKKKKRLYTLLIVWAALITSVFLGVGIYYGSIWLTQYAKEVKIEKTLTKAMTSMEAGDYITAITAYEEVIALDKYEISAYAGCVNSMVKNSDEGENVRDILNRLAAVLKELEGTEMALSEENKTEAENIYIQAVSAFDGDVEAELEVLQSGIKIFGEESQLVAIYETKISDLINEQLEKSNYSRANQYLALLRRTVPSSTKKKELKSLITGKVTEAKEAAETKAKEERFTQLIKNARKYIENKDWQALAELTVSSDIELLKEKMGEEEEYIYFIDGETTGLGIGYYLKNEWSTASWYLGDYVDGVRSGNGGWYTAYLTTSGVSLDMYEGGWKYDAPNGSGIDRQEKNGRVTYNENVTVKNGRYHGTFTGTGTDKTDGYVYSYTYQINEGRYVEVEVADWIKEDVKAGYYPYFVVYREMENGATKGYYGTVPKGRIDSIYRFD